jgi:hypothetical protein
MFITYGEHPMSCYRITFFKNLLSSDGHPFKCIQRVFDIHRARSLERAVEAAELRYERLHRGHAWTVYADGLEVFVDRMPGRPLPSRGHRAQALS